MSDGHLRVGVAFDGTQPLPYVLDQARALDVGEAIDHLWLADERFQRDVFVEMGALAAATSRLELATCVTDAFIRHPALTGAAIASVEDLAPGRAILGLGAGASGFGALGIDRHAPATALREMIGFLRRFWSSAAPFSFDGKLVRFHDARLGFRPTTSIPIYVAGRGPKILELAGELADGVLVATFLDGPLLEASLARVAVGETRRESGLPPLRRVSWAYTSIDNDRDAARDAVRRGIAVALWGSRPIVEELGIPLPASLRRAMDERVYSIEPEVIEPVAALVPDELIDACSISGPAIEVASRLRMLSDRGFHDVACWLFPTPGVPHAAMLKRLEREVVPALRSIEAQATL